MDRRRENPGAGRVAAQHLADSWHHGLRLSQPLGGVLIDSEGEEPLTRFYTEFSGQTENYEEVMYAKKQLVLRESFAADLHRLTSLLVQVCERHPRYRDYTRRELLVVLREIIACFPVYRTYARARSGEISETDSQTIERAVEQAKTHRPEVEEDLYHFVRDILLLRFPGDVENEFVMRFQQVTGPVMAKGVEDTAFYNYNRLLALNEVGGDPGKFGYSLEQFHWNCLETLKSWPRTMLTTTTHDTKRSEDVRARIALLSEIPEQWASAVTQWATHNERHKQNDWPDRNFEYALYQTLFGAWPVSTERAVEYARKAMREAKALTSWTQPRPEYEDAVIGFVEAILGDETFLGELDRFLAAVESRGLGQLAHAGPGQTHLPGRSRRLSRQRAVGLQSGRSR
jgi:(1->4)-alpha-D-glucan 1-alpha-D-glucosylmutase